MVNTKVKLCGITLSNPIIPASGTFGFGQEFAQLYDINCLGTFALKAITKEKRYGNPTPRIAEGKNGIINAVGLENPGIHDFLKEELPELKRIFKKKVILMAFRSSTVDWSFFPILIYIEVF